MMVDFRIMRAAAGRVVVRVETTDKEEARTIANKAAEAYGRVYESRATAYDKFTTVTAKVVKK